MDHKLRYILITPARNEAQYIELTIRSMIAQTHPPLRWIIVSDGSTDGTDDIVSRYLADYPWIELLRMPERKERHFAGKVHAFSGGFDRVKHLDFEVIGNLDGDASFESTHFEFLLEKMRENPQLGLAGAPFREGNFQYDYRYTNIENVWGGCQLFRRECYEAIGGYLPSEAGCIDHMAVLSARMHGWETRTFTERVCVHHRRMGTAMQGGLKAKFRHGGKDYLIRNHPLWQLFRACYQMKHPPLILGGVGVGAGYACALLARRKTPLSPEMVAFARREQMRRLKRLVVKRKPKQPIPDARLDSSTGLIPPSHASEKAR